LCFKRYISFQLTPEARTDKITEKLLDYMKTHSQGLEALIARIDSFEDDLRRVERNTRKSLPVSDITFTKRAPVGAAAGLASWTVEDVALRTRNPDWSDHRTAPQHLLLLWPSIRPLLEQAQVEYKNDYVIEVEERKILQLWGQDEGSNAGRSQPRGAGGLKANGEIDLDVDTVNTLYESYLKNIHVMHPFLDKSRLRMMLDNFIERYHTDSYRAAFRVGKEDSRRPLKKQRLNGPTTNAVIGSDKEVPLQIKRSPGNAIIFLVLAIGKICLHRASFPASVPTSVPDSKVKVNATTMHQILINRYLSASSLTSTTIKGFLITPNQTPTTHPKPSSKPTLRQNESKSRSSSPRPRSGALRNIDVVPGIAYYAKAVEILGDEVDGNDLVHAQMFLLAALYKGQLTRVKESMSWITMAGRAILILLDRYKLYNENYWEEYNTRMQFERSQKQIKDKRMNLIVIASWTCLQLESEILAELRLPASGIRGIEHLLLMPNRIYEDDTYSGEDSDGQDDILLIYYSAQIFIQRRLNQVHREIYGKESPAKPLSEVREMLSGHNSILSAWRQGLPDILQWNDNDDPPSDILNASLRAKYWGARYLINRPFLDYALHILPRLQDGKTVDSAALDSVGNPRDKADIHLFKAIEQLDIEEIFGGSRRCIEAAVHSTVAFDSVPNRLIVANIHSTAHA